MRAMPGRHRGDAFQIEARQAAAVLHHFALALHHVDQHVGLAVHGRGEVSVADAGIVELRWMSFETTPPMVSMPSDSGVTSSSS